jgi:hypothetical protein
MDEFGNGLSDGTVPSLFIRRTLPTRLDIFCGSSAELACPIEIYNLSSSPNCNAPHANSPSGLAGILSKSTFSCTALLSNSVNRTTLLKLVPDLLALEV